MRKTYTIPEENRERVTKLINRAQKKAETYGVPFKVEYGDPYAEEIPVYKVDYATNTKYRAGGMMIEVFDITIESEIIRKDGYTVVAKLEHLEGGNVVTPFGETEMDPRWATIPAKCEHCGTNHSRKVTFIVRHSNGTERQVGSTCLKDYCGIDPQMIGWFNKVSEAMMEMDAEHNDYVRYPVGHAYDIIKVLALATKVLKRQGYVRSGEIGCNRDVIAGEMQKYDPTETELKDARKMADAIAEIDQKTAIEALLNNVQALIKSGYCKGNHFGYLAYAPVAYQKYVERMERKAKIAQAKESEAKSSEWVGSVGDKIEVVVTIKLLTSWETMYGHTYLYKMVDGDGNVYVWFASRSIKECDTGKIKGTIKDHTERDGVKQTVLTRCKVA